MWFTIIDDLEGDSPESIERNLDIKKAEVEGESDENAGIKKHRVGDGMSRSFDFFDFGNAATLPESEGLSLCAPPFRTVCLYRLLMCGFLICYWGRLR